MIDGETTPRHGTHVFVVDDSKMVLAATTQELEAAGFRVSTRSLALGSVVEILRHKPDVVLLDLSMPVLKGEKLAAMIAMQTQTPVIIFTALPLAEAQKRVDGIEVLGILNKAMHSQTLGAQILELLQQHPSRTRHPACAHTEHAASGV